ncbi:MAG: hypothetical protein U0610_15005 [bacterium]
MDPSSARDDDDLPVLEPEVLPPEGPRPDQAMRERMRLVRHALLIDALNVLLRGGIAIRIGFPVGALAAFVMLRRLGWRGQRLWTAAALAGLYVMVPDPGWVPLAALAALVAPLGGRAVPRGPV